MKANDVDSPMLVDIPFQEGSHPFPDEKNPALVPKLPLNAKEGVKEVNCGDFISFRTSRTLYMVVPLYDTPPFTWSMMNWKKST